MPELPEVETVKIGIINNLINSKVVAVEVTHPRTIREHVAGEEDFISQLLNKTLLRVQRRGKFIWLVFAETDEVLIIHLGMSGQIIIGDNLIADRHTRLHLKLLNSKSELVDLFSQDQRTFGKWFWSPMELAPNSKLYVPKKISHIAPDVFSVDYSAARVIQQAKNSGTTIKSFLLNQNAISGIGNIYADEILWYTQISPISIAKNIPIQKFEELLFNTRKVLEKAIENKGTSFDSLYVDINGRSGTNQNNLKVYGRGKENCLRCDNKLSMVKISGRTSVFCSGCQINYS